MLNGAFFRSSGEEASSVYSKTLNLAARPSEFVSLITSGAGPLDCRKGSFCWFTSLLVITLSSEGLASYVGYVYVM